MTGYLIAEEEYMHQGIRHQLLVAQSAGSKTAFCFEVRRIAPGEDHLETIYEKTVDLSSQLAESPNTKLDQLIAAEISSVKREVNIEEDSHIHDP